MQTDLIVIQIARNGVDNWVSINNCPRRDSRQELLIVTTRGPFLESPETFRAHFGWQFSLYLQNKGVTRPETLQLF